MVNNIGKASSVIRMTAGLSILALYLTQVLNGTTGTVLFSLAGLLIVSGAFRTCPITYLSQRKIRRD